MPFQTVLYEKRDRVGIVTLNRPDKLNAINDPMVEEVSTLAGEIMSDDGVRAVIFTGAGRGFCSGADLSGDMTSATAPAPSATQRKVDPLLWVGRWCLAVHGIEKPTIAAVNGFAVGAGLSMACACDIRIASEAARFSAIFIRRALTPDAGATYFLPRLVGLTKASELCLTGEIIDAREAEKIGLVNRVVPAEQLLDAAVAFATRLADGPPITTQLTKRALQRSLSNDLLRQLHLEADLVKHNTTTEDVREGIRAFVEKRAPRYQGR